MTNREEPLSEETILGIMRGTDTTVHYLNMIRQGLVDKGWDDHLAQHAAIQAMQGSFQVTVAEINAGSRH